MTSTATENANRRRANNKLTAINREYHDGLPLAQINAILTKHGFSVMEASIYCGRDGHTHEQVGLQTWLSLTWHKMEETGRYEIVAYLS
jgi:hypothetical protein